MSIRVHPAKSRRASTWKNGNGVTQEVAVYPPSADLDNFAWRVSIAEVCEDGTFSIFHGVDRKLAILDGTLILNIGSESAITLSGETKPVAFRGDILCKVEIFGHLVRDLNVMTRRGHFSSRLTMVEVGGPATIAVEAGKTLVVALDNLTIEMDQSAVQLGPLDAAAFEDVFECQSQHHCNISPDRIRETARFYIIDLIAECGS